MISFYCVIKAKTDPQNIIKNVLFKSTATSNIFLPIFNDHTN